MAISTHEAADGELLVFGDLENYPNAIMFRDRSGTAVVINAPSGDTIRLGIGDTDELDLDATNMTLVGSNLVVTAGTIQMTAGAKLTLGALATFATTQPTSALVMKEGTAPAGAITTSSALFSSSTVVRKIIADGTASNVET